jgi:hypothetical protein
MTRRVLWTDFITLVSDGEGGVRHETGDEIQRCPGSGWYAVRFREDKPEDLDRARAEVTAWREQHPLGTAEQLVADLGIFFHQGYGPVLRGILFAVDSHGAKITTGVSIVESR